MYLIIGHQNEIIETSETMEYQSNGNPLVHNGGLAISKHMVKEVVEVDALPKDYAPWKYFYDGKGGFVENPNWVDPTYTMPATKEDILDLMDALADLYIMMGV